MADTAHNAHAAAWETTFAQYTQLNHTLSVAPPHDRDQLERKIAALQDDLLDTPAPSLVAISQKLEILWEGKMLDLDQASEERRLILEDLEGLIQAQRELLGS